MEKLFSKIRRRETWFYEFLYTAASRFRRMNMPGVFLPLYRIISILRQALMDFLRRVGTIFYYEPMFRSRCKRVGAGLLYVKLRQGFPYLYGDLHIFIGNNVTVHSRSSFSAASVFDNPSLYIGDRTYLGPGLSVGVAKQVSIGASCYVSTNVSISDNDGHPLDPIKRAEGKPVAEEDVLPVRIGDYVWIGEGSAILKGVTIGEGAVVGAKSVVVRDIEPFTVVAGNPAVVIGRIPQRSAADVSDELEQVEGASRSI